MKNHEWQLQTLFSVFHSKDTDHIGSFLNIKMKIFIFGKLIFCIFRKHILLNQAKLIPLTSYVGINKFFIFFSKLVLERLENSQRKGETHVIALPKRIVRFFCSQKKKKKK